MGYEYIREMNRFPETCSTHKCNMYWEGDWFCPKCQEEEYHLEMEAEAQWYSSSALCQQCGNSEGPDPCDKCSHYDMPLYMVKRKRKCKHFIKWVEPPEYIPTAEERYQEQLWYILEGLSQSFQRFRWAIFKKFDPFVRYIDVFGLKNNR